jgi:hypothetical protein
MFGHLRGRKERFLASLGITVLCLKEARTHTFATPDTEARFTGGDTYLCDAMAAAVGLLKTRPPTRRRVLLVGGESKGNPSKAKLAEVVRDAANANIALLCGTQHQSPRPANQYTRRTATQVARPAIWLLARGTNEMNGHQLEPATGAADGIDYRTFHDSEILQAVDRIGAELHAQSVVLQSAIKMGTNVSQDCCGGRSRRGERAGGAGVLRASSRKF